MAARTVGAEALAVDRHGMDPGPRPPDLVAGVAVAGALDRDVAAAPVGQRPHHQAEAVPEPVADDDLLGPAGHAPHPAQVAGDRRPQPGQPGGVEVAEIGVGHRRQRGAGGAAPGGPGEEPEVGQPRAEVVGEGRRRRGRRRPHAVPGRRRDVVDHGARPLDGGDVALGRQLLVGVDHDAPGDAEVGGEGPAGREPGARHQPPVADGGAQPVLHLGPQAPAPGPVEIDEQIR